jgi:hypothetical protein
VIAFRHVRGQVLTLKRLQWDNGDVSYLIADRYVTATRLPRGATLELQDADGERLAPAAVARRGKASLDLMTAELAAAAKIVVKDRRGNELVEYPVIHD